MSDRLPIDDRIDERLRARREVRPAGFADRTLGVIRRSRRRARILAFGQFAAAAAACLLLALPLLPVGAETEAERLVHVAGEYELGLPALDDTEALAAFVLSEG